MFFISYTSTMREANYSPFDTELSLREVQQVLDGDEVDERIANVASYMAVSLRPLPVPAVKNTHRSGSPSSDTRNQSGAGTREQ